MKLMPTLKLKKRYIVFEVLTDVTEASVKEAVRVAAKDFLGEYGLAKAGMMFIKFKNNKFIIKVNHNYVDQCKAALILIKKINNKSVIVKSLITSGTIKKASTHI